MSDKVINLPFVQDAVDSIPDAPLELQNEASQTLSVVLGTFWTAGYLYGYEDGCRDTEANGS